MGETIAVWGVNYIYSGKLVAVNDSEIKLVDAKVVYETGELGAAEWKDAQQLPSDWYIRLSAVESYGKVDHD